MLLEDIVPITKKKDDAHREKVKALKKTLKDQNERFDKQKHEQEVADRRKKIHAVK